RQARPPARGRDRARPHLGAAQARGHDARGGPQVRRHGLSPFDPDPAPMAQVIDTQVDRVPVRVYVPQNAGPDWVVYYHGGGGVIGSIMSSDAATRYLAHQTRCTFASVDYRLGPEDPHPAAIDDAFAAYEG